MTLKYQVSKDDGVTWIDADAQNGHVFNDIDLYMIYKFKVRSVDTVNKTESKPVTLRAFAREDIKQFFGSDGKNLNWVYNPEAYAFFSINGSGDMSHYSETNPPSWKDVLKEDCFISIEGQITSIGAYSFANITSITEVNITENVKTIAEGAFSGCTNLTKVIFEGDAPTLGTNVFKNTDPSLEIHYKIGTIGWNYPQWKNMNLIPV